MSVATYTVASVLVGLAVAAMLAVVAVAVPLD